MRFRIIFSKVLKLTITILTPFVILMFAIRLLITPTFANFEYRLPGFPEDIYGFTLEDRLQWSKPSILYLLNNDDISYLEKISFDDGSQIFNERELIHMEDVKDVVIKMRIALAACVLLVFLAIIVLRIREEKQAIINALNWGGWSMIGLVLAILLFVALNFDSIFNGFHQVFFESGTWQFYPSDTLIRLFPMRFWRDAFIFVGLQSLLYAGFLILFTKRKTQLQK